MLPVAAPGVNRPDTPEASGPFFEKMRRLAATRRELWAEAKSLDAAISANLKELGHGN